MGDKKRTFIGFAILSTILSVLGVAFYKLFPKMKECCKGMWEKCCPPEEKKEKKGKKK